jgi:hypothetical protein
MKTLCIALFVAVFSSLSAQEVVVSREMNNKLEDAFNMNYRLNRASKNDNGYYIEALSAGKLYAVTTDLKGNILSKELAFTFPEGVYKSLSEKCSSFKLEDIRKTETDTQFEVICNDKRIAYNISKQGKVTEVK